MTNFKCSQCGLMNSTIDGTQCRRCGTEYDPNAQPYQPQYQAPPQSQPQPYYQQTQKQLAPAPGFACPFCQSHLLAIDKKTGVGGWVVFAVLVITCFPLCWLGLLMKEDVRKCGNCGVKLDR